jgi:hypothetical protein
VRVVDARAEPGSSVGWRRASAPRRSRSIFTRFAEDPAAAALSSTIGTTLEVPWADGAPIAAAWPGAELVTTHRLGPSPHPAGTRRSSSG